MATTRSTPSKSNIKQINVWIFLFFLSTYLLTTGGHFYSADTEIKALITEGIVERRSVALPVVNMVYMVPGRDGLSYSTFPVGTSLTMIPLYIIGTGISNLLPAFPRELILEFCLSLINQIVTALTCVLLFAICHRLGYSIRTAVVATLTYGLCTVAWPYAKTGWSEPQALLCAVAAIYCVLRFREELSEKIVQSQGAGRYPYRWILFAGLCLGYAVTTKYEMFLFVLTTGLLIIFYLWQTSQLNWRHCLSTTMAYGIPLAIFAFLNLYYNYLRFESWFSFGDYTRLHNEISEVSDSADSFLGILVGAYQHIFSSGRSILLFSPPLIMIYWAMKLFYRRHPTEAWFCIVTTVAFFIFTGMYWHVSGISWGERYLFVLTPVLMLPLCSLIEGIIDQRERYMRKSLITFAALGFCIQIIGISVNFQTTVEKLMAQGVKYDIQLISYDPEYSPVLLNLEEFTANLSGTWRLFTEGVNGVIESRAASKPSLTTSDFVQKANRDIIRYHTYDFWFLYLYFIKFPKFFILVSFCILAGAMVQSARKIYHYLSVYGAQPYP